MISNQTGANDNLPSASKTADQVTSFGNNAEGPPNTSKEEEDLLNSDKEDDGINDLLSMTLDEKMSDK